MNGIDGTIRINPGFKSSGFSKTEILHILISVAVLSIAFAITYIHIENVFSYDPVINAVCWVIASVLMITFSFLVHELAHKFVAQKYVAWAEYRMFPAGLVLALIVSFFGFLFAAPGAVYIDGRMGKKENGIISLAGPATNLAMCVIFSILAIIVYDDLIMWTIFYLTAHINLLLALFNLIPIQPFDGSKIVAWNIPVYIVILVITLGMFLL